MSIYDNLNLANSIFKGLNDKNGLLICGYEHGINPDKQFTGLTDDEIWQRKNATIFTFANKTPFLGDGFFNFNKYRYDNIVAKWFELWGHSLDRENLGGNFEKSIMQTNISPTANKSVEDYNEISKNFDYLITHFEVLQPSLVLFMGRRLTDFINQQDNYEKFIKVVGNEIGQRKMVQKESGGFQVFFQNFEKCKTVCFPHPSGAKVAYNYIKQFKPEMDKLLQEYKQMCGF
ncbi:hypothetical protein [Faucicola boevrei]|uniref:hypothetical protein n=1 Tax=Faucicola boevrei TaxID=346665 RepID=UPI00037B1351|nr:hypothetical protein [Moraxella boevrei]